MSLWNNSFGEKALAALEEHFYKELPEGFTVNDVFLADDIFDNDRLFAVIASIQKNSGNMDMADFAVNIFPDGNSLIYCMDDDVFHHTDETAVETALKQAAQIWIENEPYFTDMKTIKNTIASMRENRKPKKGIAI